MSQIQENKLPQGWIETTLGEVSIFQYGLGESAQDTGEYLYIRITDINTDGSLKKSDLTYISKEKVSEKDVLKKGDILVARTGASYGKSYIFKEDIKSTFGGFLIRLNLNENKIDNYFLFSFMRTHLYWGQANSLVGGGAQPQFNANTLCNISLSLPPLSEQQAIAKILSSFDDKIELLREQNETLEKIGQEIFKEWFGKYKVGDELPEGWRVGKLGEEFDITIGRTPPRLETQWFSKNQKDYKWISIKNIGNCGTYIFETSEFLTKEAVEKFNIPIIPENTTILSFKMTVGKLTITTEKMLSNEAIAHLKVKENSILSSEYIYTYLQNLDFNSLGSTSSIVTAINSTMIKNLEFIIPKNTILVKFNEAIKLVFEKIKINSEQIQTLSKTRDELLPRLMKGEIRVV